jgi:hypothetical protein
VARKDKKPLNEEHMDAVHMYVSRLLHLFGNDPKYAQKETTRAAFEKWFENYRALEIENGHTNWEKVGSLFDVPYTST